jgi:hypothetical protein
MFLIPYRLQPSQSSETNFTLSTLWVFTTKGGTSLWETDEDTCTEEEILKEYLHANGFKGRGHGVKGGCYLFEVDPCQTPLSDFYSWTDFLQMNKPIPKDCDVWRPFVWVDTEALGTTNEWGWNTESEKETLGAFGTVRTLWELIRTCTVNRS